MTLDTPKIGSRIPPFFQAQTLTEVILRICVPVVVKAEGAEAALDPDRAGAQEGVGRLA